MSWIAAAEFSRRMQCSRANVTQAISSGRIAPEHVRRDGTRVLVNTNAIPSWQATASRRRGINEPSPLPTPAAAPLPMVPVEGLPALAWGGGEEGAMDAALTPEEIGHLLGMDHRRLTYRFNGRDFRLTDVAGVVVNDILA